MSRGAMLLLCVLCVAAEVRGAPSAVQEEETTTLHVYTNLIQLPVLVLSPFHERMGPIAAERFSISVDDGPQFRATHVRPEGDDPIALSILLDISKSETEILPKLDEAVAELAPQYLRPQDRVSIYALDCALMRSSNDLPAQRELLKHGIATVLRSWTDRGRDKHGAGCSQKVHLWDALFYLTGAESKLPGRRVILAVTDGRDKGSSRTASDLRTYAQGMGVTIFGLTYAPYTPGRFQRRDYDSVFPLVCESSGGLAFTADENNVGAKLRWLTTILRERYIVEFPRPSNSTAGQHILAVKIQKSNAFIRTAGISVPLPDPALLADPTTVRSDPSLAPEMGAHHIQPAPR